MDLERIIEQVSQSRKARSIYPETIRRLCKIELGRRDNEKQVIKAVKGKLHQMHSAYVGREEHDKALELISRIEADSSRAETREICGRLLQLHASTAERLDFYADFYRRLFALTGKPRSILDIACGFNPFSIPWMETGSETEYLAADINLRTIDLLNKFFRAASIRGEAFLADAMEFSRFRNMQKVDVAFVFKLVPLLEKQEKNSSRALIEAINARFVAVSFPVRTLSGRTLNMLEQNSDLFENKIVPGFSGGKLVLDNELIYVIDKGG